MGDQIVLTERVVSALKNVVEGLTTALLDIVHVAETFDASGLTPERKLDIVRHLSRIHSAIGVAGSVVLCLRADNNNETDPASALIGLDALAGYGQMCAVIGDGLEFSQSDDGDVVAARGINDSLVANNSDEQIIEFDSLEDLTNWLAGN